MLNKSRDAYFLCRAFAVLTSVVGLALLLWPQRWRGPGLEVLVERLSWSLVALAGVVMVCMAVLALHQMLSHRNDAPASAGKQ